MRISKLIIIVRINFKSLLDLGGKGLGVGGEAGEEGFDDF